MYTASFGLRCLPFENRADAAFFFASPTHEEAIAAMQYEIQHGTGVGLLLGETGTGKTILIRALARRLSSAEKVVVLTIAGNGGVDVIRETCKGFGVSLPASIHDARGLGRLEKHLTRSVGRGNRPVLIIDQAENLSPGDLSDIETLLDLSREVGRLLRVVLAGHCRLRGLLDQPAFTRLRQLAYNESLLRPFSEDEVGQYIRHRLSEAGSSNTDIFSDDAVVAVYSKSQGIPRVINQVCNAAMLAAYGEESRHVTSRHVGEKEESRPRLIDPSLSERRDPYAPIAGESTSYELDDFKAELLEAESASVKSALEEAKRVEARLRHGVSHVEQAGTRAKQRAQLAARDAESIIGSLESKLSAASQRAEQALTRVERVEDVFHRAEELEKRLTAFADQLSDQMDRMEEQVAGVVKYAIPLDEARCKLEESIRRAESVRQEVKDNAEGQVTRIREQQKHTSDLLRKSAAEIAEAVADQIRTDLDRVSMDAKSGLEKTQAAVEATARECQDTIKQMALESTRLKEQQESASRALGQSAGQAAQHAAHQASTTLELLRKNAKSIQEKTQEAIAGRARECHDTIKELALESTRLKEQQERAGRTLRQSAAEAAADAANQVRTILELLPKEAQSILEKTQSAILSTARECQDTIHQLGQESIRLKEQQECASAILRKTAIEATESAASQVSTTLELIRKDAKSIQEKTQEAIASAAREYQGEISCLLQESKTQVEKATRAAAEQITGFEIKLGKWDEHFKEAGKVLEAAEQKAQQTCADLQRQAELAQQETHNAHEASAGLRLLQSEITQVGSRLGAEVKTAQSLSESIGTLINSADMKSSQLTSCQAAVAHLHERMARLLQTAHPVVERADGLVGRLAAEVSQGEKLGTQLSEISTNAKTDVEQARQAATRAAQEAGTLTDQIAAAEQVGKSMDHLREQAMRDLASLESSAAKCSQLLGRLENAGAMATSAAATHESLKTLVPAGNAVAEAMSTLLEKAGTQQMTMQEAMHGIEKYCQAHDEARFASEKASEAMRIRLKDFQDAMRHIDEGLAEYYRRVAALESQLQHVDEQTSAAQAVTTQVQSVVDDAQSQSEHLERVCVAVRKVFSGLSQASLNARNQSSELEQFIQQANETARSLQQWLDRVRRQLDAVAGSALHTTRNSAATTGHAASIEKHAELLIEGEPGAQQAHLVEGGLDVEISRSVPAREISQLIEKARKAKSGEADAELAEASF